MSGKGGRFSYVKKADGREEQAVKPGNAQAKASAEGGLPPLPDTDALRRPRRGEGRYPQDDEARRAQAAQLNVRVTPALKRRALAQAALEGRTIGDLVEALLLEYLQRASNQQ